MDICDLAENVENEFDFIQFLKALREDFRQNKEEWDNDDLDSFLNGLISYCHNKSQPGGTDWKTFADMLLSATVYE